MTVKSIVRVFISYSQKDSSYLESLWTHMSQIRKEKDIYRIHTKYIEEPEKKLAGKHFDNLTIEDILLILISPDWNDHSSILESQIRALQRNLNNQVPRFSLPIIPIYIRPIDDDFFKKSPISQYTILPQRITPLSSMSRSEQEEAFSKIPGRIRESRAKVIELRKKLQEVERKQLQMYQTEVKNILESNFFPPDIFVEEQIKKIQGKSGLTNEQVSNIREKLLLDRKENDKKYKENLRQAIVEAVEKEYPSIEVLSVDKLEKLALAFQVSAEYFEAIFKAIVLDKKIRYENSKQKYLNIFLEEIHSAYPLSDLSRANLLKLAQDLGLKNEDVSQIEEEAFKAEELKSQSLSSTELDPSVKSKLFSKLLWGILLISILLLAFPEIRSLPDVMNDLFPPPFQPSEPPKPLCPLPISVAEAPGEYSINKWTKFLNAKEGLQPECAVVFRIPSGTVVSGTGELSVTDNGEKWAKISFDGQVGWVPKKFLSKHINGQW